MGWVALVGPEIEENLSLRYLASSLTSAGYRAEIVPFAYEGEFHAALASIAAADEPPLVVGVSLAFQWRAMDMIAFVMALREAGYAGHVTTGGHFATFACRDLLADFPEIDSVCRQEAEETLVALVRAVEQGAPLGQIAGLALREGGEVRLTGMPSLPDLAKLPTPDRRGEPARCFDHGIAPLVSSRGCYANCSFCCIAAWHEQTLPGKRYRLRDVEAVADEMVALQRERGIDTFVFHDDNFFVPGRKKNLERFEALADALEARGIGPFATVVKARPTDVDAGVFHVLKHRLNCIRVYIGVETDSDQGLETLRRWARPRQNHEAIEIVRALDLYCCFNLLIFDPDTTLDTLEINVDFLEFASDYPFNFARVELYAGTPLLQRMQAEGRVRGDWVQWDYSLSSPEIERVFQLTMQAFHPRNFGDDALHNRIMGTRFDVEVVKHFHRDRFDDGLHARGVDLSRELARDTARGLRAVLERVRSGADPAGDAAFLRDLSAALRDAEARIGAGCRELAADLVRLVGRGRPLTDVGDRVATPLQRAVSFAVGAP